MPEERRWTLHAWPMRSWTGPNWHDLRVPHEVVDASKLKEQEERCERLEQALRHFESEANAADELALNTGLGGIDSRYEVPWRRRYEIERDTYRYVVETARTALEHSPGDEGAE